MAGDKWLLPYFINFKVVVEIWESALLIKSDEFNIDGQQYQIP